MASIQETARPVDVDVVDPSWQKLATELVTSGAVELTEHEVLLGIRTIYLLLPEVNEYTQKRRQDLDLEPIPPLTRENVILLRDSEFHARVRKEAEQTAHPLLAAVFSAMGSHMAEWLVDEPTAAIHMNGTVYINIDQWFHGERLRSDEELTSYLSGALMTLRHEDIHRSCTPRFLEKAGARWMGILIYGDTFNDLLPHTILNRENKVGKHLTEYLDFFYKLVFDQSSSALTVKIDGATVTLFADGLVLKTWNKYDEAFVDYEQMRRVYGIRAWQKMVHLPSPELPEGVSGIVDIYRSEFSHIRSWDRSFGNKTLMRAYYLGELYDLLNSGVRSLVDLFEVPDSLPESSDIAS